MPSNEGKLQQQQKKINNFNLKPFGMGIQKLKSKHAAVTFRKNFMCFPFGGSLKAK